MSINMNLIPHRRLTNLFMLGCSAFALSLYSCNKSGESTPLTGETVVKINLSGVEAYNESDNAAVQKQASAGTSHASSSAPDVQEMTIPMENGGSIDVVLTNSSAVTKSLVASSNPKLATAQTVEKPLDKNVKYKVVVYDSQGAYVTEKTYNYGEEATAAGIVLDAGKSYTFIAYSINSTTALPSINNQNTLSTASLNNISGDLMYYTGTLTLKNGVNNLNVVLKHRFSQITTTLTMDPSMTGAITQIGTAVLKPSHSSANLKFSDETLTYNGLNNAGVTTQFPALGNGLRTLIINPSLLIHPTTSNGTLMLSSLTIDDETKTNITIPNVKINPGQKYDLKLNFRTCTQDVTSDGLNWSYPATTSNGKIGIMKDGKFYPNGTAIDRSFTAPAADYGFVFDITELDNAFNMEVNGVKLAKQELQFQSNAVASTQNVQFSDGSKYAGNNIEAGLDKSLCLVAKHLAALYMNLNYLMETASTPSLGVQHKVTS